jgi:hypothetical protein
MTPMQSEIALMRWRRRANSFDGEFANGSQTYAGSGTLRNSW